MQAVWLVSSATAKLHFTSYVLFFCILAHIMYNVDADAVYTRLDGGLL